MYPLYKYYANTGPFNLFAVKFTGETAGVVVYSEEKARPVGFDVEGNWTAHTNSCWRDPASPKEWLQLLEEPYGSLAVKHLEEQAGTYRQNYKRVNSLTTALYLTLCWAETPEGHSFWSQVNSGLKPPVPNKSDHLIFVKESPGLSEICLDFAKKKGILSVTEEGGPFVCFNSKNKTFTCPKETKNTPVSLSEFIKALEDLPDKPEEVTIDNFFGRREALIQPGGVVIGCQIINNDKLSEIHKAVSKVRDYKEEVELDGMELTVNSLGVHADGFSITFREFEDKFRQIRMEQAKL